MMNVNEKRYPNISEAVAFRIAFAPMAYSYGDIGWDDIERYVCGSCGLTEQYADFLAPKTSFKKKFAILDTYHYGVNADIRNELIENFDVTEDDFRPCRNKVGDIVSKGDELGTVKDYFGNILHTCIAKVDGIILYQVGSLSILKDGPMITYGEI